MRRVLSWTLVLLGLLTMAGAGVWSGRRAVLAWAGGLLVAEDPVAEVDLLVISGANPLGAAVEVVRLYHEGVSPRVVVPCWPPDDLNEESRRLDIAHLDMDPRVLGILERGGVPPAAIVMLTDAVDGTGPETSAIAAFARAQGIHSLLVVTARGHSARVRWLLRRALAPAIEVRARSPRDDTFMPTAWWRDRGQSREVAMEYLRWINMLVLGDPWARRESEES